MKKHQRHLLQEAGITKCKFGLNALKKLQSYSYDFFPRKEERNIKVPENKNQWKIFEPKCNQEMNGGNSITSNISASTER
jgi:hypothetical protein